VNHPTVALTDPNGQGVEIDVDIAPLIEGLWRKGVLTAQSCQESIHGYVWIAFLDVGDALDFLEALGLSDATVSDQDAADESSLPFRAMSLDVASPGGWAPPPSEDDGSWRWSAFPIPSENTFSMAVDFPRTDLPELIVRVSR
jgi:hypothetical protein